MLAQLAAWMSERFFRTFRVEPDASTRFDAILLQRGRRIGVSIGLLWDGEPAPGVAELEAQLTDDLDTPGAYVVWLPPGATLPDQEPRQSELRILLARGMSGLDPAERREVRIPVTFGLAKIDDEGAYMSVAGGLAPHWSMLSEGINGAFHLDTRELRRLPEEQAEIEILLTRVRDHAAALETGEATPVQLDDYWLVSRIPGDQPAGVTIFGAPADVDPAEGPTVRRFMRQQIRRALEQSDAANSADETFDLHALALGTPLAHLRDEMATAALRGMNPTTYGGLDLITLAADGSVRQVLQPRTLPWEAVSASPPR